MSCQVCTMLRAGKLASSAFVINCASKLSLTRICALKMRLTHMSAIQLSLTYTRTTWLTRQMQGSCEEGTQTVLVIHRKACCDRCSMLCLLHVFMLDHMQPCSVQILLHALMLDAMQPCCRELSRCSKFALVVTFLCGFSEPSSSLNLKLWASCMRCMIRLVR